MKKYISLSFVFALTVLAFVGCKDRSDLTAPAAPSLGTADFTRFVTIGNSITAGYQSGALYESAQKYAYGNQIAKQVGTSFAFPNYSDPGTGGRVEAQSITPFVSYINPNKGVPTNLTYAAPYNNLGIPGAALYDFNNAWDSSSCFTAVANPLVSVKNPMFNLVLRNQGTAKLTQFQQAKALHPTMVTFWLGNNDILGYATRGGTIPFTPTNTFAFLYSQAMDSLKSLGCPVVVANLPDVSVIPFLTTVGTQLYLAGKTAVWAVRGVGDTIPVNVLTNYLTLNASGELAVGKGTSKANPLSNGVVLDSLEIIAAKATVLAYNTTIASLAAAKGFPVVDVNGVLNQIKASERTGGYVVDGVILTTYYVTGNLFSLDGVHPSNHGQALIANEFIKVMNNSYGAHIPLINLASIPGSIVLQSNPLSLPKSTKFNFNNFNTLMF